MVEPVQNFRPGEGSPLPAPVPGALASPPAGAAPAPVPAAPRQVEAASPAPATSREIANVQLAAMIESHRGETLEDLKLRGDLRDLQLAVLQGGSDTPPAALVDTARGLMSAHYERIAAAGADAGAQLEVTRKGAPGGFDAGRYLFEMFSAGKHVHDPDCLAGSPEAEVVKGIFGGGGDRADMLNAKFAEVKRNAKAGASVIPIPVSGLGIGRNALTQFAQTYGNGSTDVDQYRSDDYRRDLLTPFHRPMLVLDKLGASQITVSNDINVPRVTGAQTASWVGENSNAPDQSLTVNSTKTDAKRLAAKTDISWMLTAAADQIGIVPLVISELNRAMMQQREIAAFGAGGTNMPTGLAGTTGVNDPGVNAQPTTLAHIKAFEQSLMEDNIPMEDLRWLLSVADSIALSTALTFGSSSSFAAIPMFRSSMDVGAMGMMSGYDGFVVSRPACVSNNVPSSLGGGNNETMVVAGLWHYLLVVDYMMAYITIDDISQALAAQTRCTINSFHDVIVRFPQAFAVDQHT